LETIRESLTHKNLDQALVQWQNMAVSECKNVKSLKSMIRDSYSMYSIEVAHEQ
jgi:hypothetical protein